MFFKLISSVVLGALLLGAGLSAASARDAVAAQIQLNLIILGYDPGPVDGAPGARTRTALEAFHAANGTTFDGTVDANDLDAIYDALAAVPFNGVPPALDAATGRTSQNRAFDFVPEVDLSTLYEPVTVLDPGALGAMLQDAQLAPSYCRYHGDPFPLNSQPLQTYSSFREFETTGRRNLHPGNRWLFDELPFAVQFAAPAAALGNAEAQAALKQGLLYHANAGSGLDTASIMDRNGKAIVYPDFSGGVTTAPALLAGYLIAADSLDLSAEERATIEQWLSRFYEAFPDSALAISDGLSLVTQEVGRAGRAMMLHALMTSDVDQFNEGARVALVAHSFVRPDGSERVGAARGNRALHYQGRALLYAMETYVILNSQGVDVETLMGPTVRRMADFWVRAWADHSVLHPYARENEAVFVGSDYRVQNIVQASPGIDMVVALGGDEAMMTALREARATYPHREMIGAAFIPTCIAQTLGDYEPPAMGGEVGLGGIESDSVLDISSARFFQIDEDQFYTGYGVDLSGVQLDGEVYRISRFEMLADWGGPKDRLGNLQLLRISFDRSALSEAESRAADFTECGEIAAVDDEWGMRFRLHFGTEAQSNACILDKMGPRDRLFWSTVLVNFNLVLDAASSDPVVDDIRSFYELKT